MLFVQMPNILVWQCSYERSQEHFQTEQKRLAFGILCFIWACAGIIQTKLRH